MAASGDWWWSLNVSVRSGSRWLLKLAVSSVSWLLLNDVSSEGYWWLLKVAVSCG